MAETYLVKDIITSIIPGNPGVPSFPGSPEIPGHYETIYVTTSIPVYSNYTAFNNLTSPGDAGESIIPGSYENTTTNTVPTYITAIVESQIWVPQQDAIPGFPGLPATPQQIITSLNIGWNTSSVSISQLIIGDYILYNLNPGLSGSFMGIGEAGLSGQHIDRFEHGIVADQTGVYVFENGQVIKTLSSLYDIDSELRIYRQADGNIVYVFISGTTVEVHESLIPAARNFIPLYVYSLLHTGGDTILNASLETGTVQFGKA